MPTTKQKPQHLSALEKANHLRFARCDIRQEIRENCNNRKEALSYIAYLLEGNAHDPEAFEGFAVLDLLKAAPRINVTMARTLMKEAGIFSELKKVRDLTDNQRMTLIGLCR